MVVTLAVTMKAWVYANKAKQIFLVTINIVKKMAILTRELCFGIDVN